ncbi:hypothetical protein [Caldimonas sp. KR1-144]|uniref:hypothetical protein n=1 Tax=Caldimonas sp. KR1-144 TaxID=3400911 RepID=UPI003C0ECBFC
MTITVTTTPTRPTSTASGWHPTNPVSERETLDMATARQIALRTRLRHHYWLTECRPFDDSTVALMRRKMTLIDARDAMDDEEVVDLLTAHYGFTRSAEGWRIADLDCARDALVSSIDGTRKRAQAAGVASAKKRAQQAPQQRVDASTEAALSGTDPADF